MHPVLPQYHFCHDQQSFAWLAEAPCHDEVALVMQLLESHVTVAAYTHKLTQDHMPILSTACTCLAVR